jgi:hypothetical protein
LIAERRRHPSVSVIRYEDSDLRMVLGLRGWLDVLALGFHPDLLNPDTRTSEVLTMGGIPFARYSLGRGSSRSRDVWWNEEQVLPSRFTKADSSGVTHFSIERITPGADAALLDLPGARFPTYRTIDLANWLERH